MIAPPTLPSQHPTAARPALGIAGNTPLRAHRLMSPFAMTAAKAVANTEAPIAACAKILEDGKAA